jgi:GDPmannose 4,6-dehydratase
MNTINNTKIAFITGITGQDGSYLAELLLEKGYIVHGLIRRSSSINTKRIDHIFSNDRLKLSYGDMTDGASLYKILNEIKNLHTAMERLEIYNLAAQSHVKISFEMPEYTADTDAFGTLKLLEAIVNNNLLDKTRLYHASTSELYGKATNNILNEKTEFYPRSPYAVAKLYAFWIVKNYRESYGLYACNGILFNHGGVRRGHNFIERKITLGLAKIVKNQENKLVLGNLDALRDIGNSKDYVEGMWLMLQQDKPDDYCLATGVMYSIRQLVEIAFSFKGFDIKWKGEGIDEIGYDANTGRELIFIDKKYFRPSEVDWLQGDATKAKEKLGWEPKTNTIELLREMVEHDCS